MKLRLPPHRPPRRLSAPIEESLRLIATYDRRAAARVRSAAKRWRERLWRLACAARLDRRAAAKLAAEMRLDEAAEGLVDDRGGLGPAPVYLEEGISPQLLRPGPLEATVICRWGLGRIQYVRATPETQTPSWWRARVSGSFGLTLHPLGVGGVRGDPARGMRECIDLGTWAGRGHLPTVPIGEAPPEITIHAPSGPVRAQRVAGRGGRAEYVVAPVAWEAAAPRRQALPPAEIYVDEPGRPRRSFTRGGSADGLTIYVLKRRTS